MVIPMKKVCMCRQRGNVGELMITGICILAMTVLMLTYMDYAELLEQKSEVGQIARKYILRMESTGYLASEDISLLSAELSDMGVTEMDYTGTTISEVTYGQPITLQIQGKLRGEYAFCEKRVSTAKH